MDSTAGQVLLVSGTASLCASTRAAARAAHCQLTVVVDLPSACSLLAKRQFDLILIDGDLADAAALCNLELTRQGHVVVAGGAHVGRDGDATQSPAFDGLDAPVSAERLARAMRDAVANSPSREITAHAGFRGMLGRTMRMQALFETIRRIAPLDVGVLVHGESGTGKELVAQALHGLSGRTGQFVAVNCGAISPELLGSQLFGHERGSFTGATQSHAGYFEQARGGTLFLDEITEMPRTLQVYLLRVIETHSLTRVGGSREIPVDVRVIAASNRDLQYAVTTGELRSDLYFRLLEFPLQIPPLRERREDISLLAQYFLDQLNAKYGTDKRFAERNLDKLIERAWPGNVRELLHTIRRQYIMAGDANPIEALDEDVQVLRRRSTDGRQVARQIDDAPGGAVLASEADDAMRFKIGTTFEEIEREALLKTLAHCHNDKRKAARVLGVSLKTIYNRLLRYRSQGLIGQDVLDDSPDDHGRAA